MSEVLSIGEGAIEDFEEDYLIGLARLSDPEDFKRPRFQQTDFKFNISSQYKALKTNHEQVSAIKKWVKRGKISL